MNVKAEVYSIQRAAFLDIVASHPPYICRMAAVSVVETAYCSHVWTAPALQEFSDDALLRSGALMCSAC